jgi:hypothetical protein
MISQAYFENIQQQILEELNKAEKNIIVAVAWLTDRQLFDKLCKKSSNGNLVELMIYNDEINRNSAIDFTRLENYGGKLYKVGNQDSRNLMHNKFCVIDHKTVINGSYNWSNKAKQNHENITVSTNAEDLALQFINEFQQLKEKYFEKDTYGQAFDLAKALKRLSLIKNLIDLGDVEDVPTQVARLKRFETDAVLDEILSELDGRKYGSAVHKIEKYINQYQQIITYVDSETQGLKLEIKSLEIQLKSLSDEKAEMEKLIFNFNIRHTKELGPLIRKILAFRKTKAKTKEELREAEQDEREYNKEYEVQKDVKINELSKNEQKAMKKAYREASKRCHPDVIAERDKKKAQEIFVRLNNAYERNDIQKVQQILKQLKTGVAFTDSVEDITEKETLSALVESLRVKVNEMVKELNVVKESEEYRAISKIDDWDAYFVKKKGELAGTLKQLQDE